MTVLKEAKQAYIDCVTDSYEGRNLGFRASQAVTPKEGYRIMSRCCPDGYNEFRAELLLLLPDDCQVTLAREGSVCIYVKPGKKRLPSRTRLKADEYGKLEVDTYGWGAGWADGPRSDFPTPYGGYKGEVRIWWD